MWRLKYLIYGMIPWAIIGVLIYLTAPRIVDAFQDKVADSARDAVAQVYDEEVPQRVEPGQIVITERELYAALLDADEHENNFSATGYDVEIEDGVVRIVDNDRNADHLVIASVVPVVRDGRIVLTERGGAVQIFKFARDAIAEEIEQQSADIFERSGVTPVEVRAENGRLVIITESIDGTNATPASVATSIPSRTSTPAIEPTQSSGLIPNPFRRTPTPSVEG